MEFRKKDEDFLTHPAIGECGRVWHLRHMHTGYLIGAFLNEDAANRAHELADELMSGLLAPEDGRDEVGIATGVFWKALLRLGLKITEAADENGNTLLALA